MRRTFEISVLLSLLPVWAWAQERADAFMEVESNLPGSLILVDSVFSGQVGKDGVVRLTAGEHRIALAPKEVGSWVLSPPEATIWAVSGDTTNVTLNFPFTYRIDSVPFGASVYREDQESSLGETPLVFTTEKPLGVALRLEKPGYATERIMPGKDVINHQSVALRQVNGELAQTDAIEFKPPPGSSKWLTYSALGLIAAGGALAVHYKFAANHRYNEYLQTADPGTKAEVDRLDRLSYVALGGLQVGLGILVYRLAF